MKYINAADVLPEELLAELSKYAGGKLLYVPSCEDRCSWGEKNGSRQYYRERNLEMKELYQRGISLDELAEQFGLAYETIRKIVK